MQVEFKPSLYKEYKDSFYIMFGAFFVMLSIYNTFQTMTVSVPNLTFNYSDVVRSPKINFYAPKEVIAVKPVEQRSAPVEYRAITEESNVTTTLVSNTQEVAEAEELETEIEGISGAEYYEAKTGKLLTASQIEGSSFSQSASAVSIEIVVQGHEPLLIEGELEGTIVNYQVGDNNYTASVFDIPGGKMVTILNGPRQGERMRFTLPVN